MLYCRVVISHRAKNVTTGVTMGTIRIRTKWTIAIDTLGSMPSIDWNLARILVLIEQGLLISPNVSGVVAGLSGLPCLMPTIL